MKDFRYFQNVHEYRAYVRGLFRSNILKTRFYGGLVDWCIDHRTPMFFEASQECEHAHFTSYFGLQLLRPNYKNEYIHDLYYLHDMVHSLFSQPHYPKTMGFEDFARLAIYNEYVSSNETEVLAYQRIPDLRPKTFDFPIFYDLLSQAGWDHWSPPELFKLRRALVDDPNLWSLLGTHKAVTATQKYMTRVGANWAWSAMWYEQTPYTFSKPFWNTWLTYSTYEAEIVGYQSALSQEHYECQLCKQVAFWAELTFPGRALSINSMSEAIGTLRQLDGEIIMPEAARIFHQIVMSKAVTY